MKRLDTDLVVAPQSLNQIVELLMGQNQKINKLQQLMQQPKNQLPDSADHTDVIADMKNELKKSREREGQLLTLVQQMQSDLDKLIKPRQNPTLAYLIYEIQKQYWRDENERPSV